MIPLIIPVRSNSTRCPNKLLRLFADNKLLLEIYLSKFEGRKDVYVAGRDKIFEKLALKYGLNFIHRTKESIYSEDVNIIWKFLDDLEYDEHVCFLNPCCPLIKASTVDKALAIFPDSIHSSLFSVKETPELVFKPNDHR